LTFARSFAELSRKYSYPQPSSARGASKEKQTPGALALWPSQSLTFGSLAAAFGACFLRLQKATLGSTSGRSKDALQDHDIGCGEASASEARLLPMQGNVNVRYPSPA